MSAKNIGLFLVIVLGAGCTAPSSSPAAVTSTASPGVEPSSSAPTVTASTEPSAEPSSPVATFPASTPATGVPAAIERVAWAGKRADLGEDGSVLQWHVYAGLLNHPPTIDDVIPGNAGFPSIDVADGTLTIATAAHGAVHLVVRSAVDGSALGDIRRSGSEVTRFRTDPKHSLLYAAITRPGGGVEIRRFAFDGSTDDLLVTLDERFTPAGIPIERYDLALDPGGVLIVEACGKVDGCRLWEIPPTATKTAPPRTLPGHPPIVCSIAGVTSAWLVVQDDEACTADSGDAALPVRAIRRSDGVGHLLTNDHVLIGRVEGTGGEVSAIGANGIGGGGVIDIVGYDLVTYQRTLLLSGISLGPDDAGLEVSRSALPSPWVLLQPWLVEESAVPSTPGRLLNLQTRETIELPIGTSGWS